MKRQWPAPFVGECIAAGEGSVARTHHSLGFFNGFFRGGARSWIKATRPRVKRR